MLLCCFIHAFSFSRRTFRLQANFFERAYGCFFICHSRKKHPLSGFDFGSGWLFCLGEVGEGGHVAVFLVSGLTFFFPFLFPLSLFSLCLLCRWLVWMRWYTSSLARKGGSLFALFGCACGLGLGLGLGFGLMGLVRSWFHWCILRG